MVVMPPSWYRDMHGYTIIPMLYPQYMNVSIRIAAEIATICGEYLRPASLLLRGIQQNITKEKGFGRR
jgi:hypothetical protein